MRSSRLEIVISLSLLVLAVVAYADVLRDNRYDFVNFDDYHYVRDNPYIQAGLSWNTLVWAFTNYDALNWHPMTWVSLLLDREIFGTRPWGFHVTNVLLHAANVVLLFLVLRRITGAVWPSAIVAAFFAVHPLHVESVAWVTERKDVLSTFFWLLTILAYAWYAERPNGGRYLLVLFSLGLGLMSKPMLVTLPCVLLLLDYWPLRRWRFSPPALTESADANGEPRAHPTYQRASVRQLVLEKVPFLLMSVGCSVLTVRAQNWLIENAQGTVSFSYRLQNALVSYVAYLRQTIWPSDLCVLYPHPLNELPVSDGIAAGLLLAGITLVVLFNWRRRPYLVVGWLWYIGTLVPVIGLLQVGPQARADRYTYVPLIGIFIAASWIAVEWLGGRRIRRVVLSAVTAALLVVCTALTWSQLKYWHNSVTLWDRALELSPHHLGLHWHVAKLCLREGDTDQAIARAEVIRRDLMPNDPGIYLFLAEALLRKGKFDEAVASLKRASALEPESASIHKKIAGILLSQLRIPAAYEEYDAVARLQPHSAEGQHYQGIVLQREGKLAAAVRCFEEAVRLQPEGVLHHVDLALALEDNGDSGRAVEHYRRAVQLNPRWPEYYNESARILATHPDSSRRDGKEAVRRARAACSVTRYGYPVFIETLAAAYAEAGLFKQAIETAERGRDLAAQAGDRPLADRLEMAHRLYKNGLPSRGAPES